VFFRSGPNIVGRFDLSRRAIKRRPLWPKPCARRARTSATPSRCGMATTASARDKRSALRATPKTYWRRRKLPSLSGKRRSSGASGRSPAAKSCWRDSTKHAPKLARSAIELPIRRKTVSQSGNDGALFLSSRAGVFLDAPSMLIARSLIRGGALSFLRTHAPRCRLHPLGPVQLLPCAAVRDGKYLWQAGWARIYPARGLDHWRLSLAAARGRGEAGLQFCCAGPAFTG
jgi:hypothetical protein